MIRTPRIEVNQDIMKMILDDLSYAGVPGNIRGYEYLKVGIGLLLEEPTLQYSITRELYPTIAEICNTTRSRVERSIRHAVELSFDRITPDVYYKIWGCTINQYRGKATNSEFMAKIAERIRLKAGAYGGSSK